MTKSIKQINDEIHDLMEMSEVLVAIMNTPQFQRLHRIKQTGCAFQVYPSAKHTRFEHSLGKQQIDQTNCA